MSGITAALVPQASRPLPIPGPDRRRWTPGQPVLGFRAADLGPRAAPHGPNWGPLPKDRPSDRNPCCLLSIRGSSLATRRANPAGFPGKNPGIDARTFALSPDERSIRPSGNAARRRADDIRCGYCRYR
jgi:hypothetical protein